MDYWEDAARRWGNLGAPLRPDAEVVSAYRRHIPAPFAGTLMLGVTPEITALCRPVIAVDSSAAMIRTVWPGDRPERRAILGDWRDIPAADASFANCIGDGSPNVFAFPADMEAFFGEVRRVLAPGGRAVFRVFCAPDEAVTCREVFARAERREIPSFHSFKFQVAGAIAREAANPNVEVAHVRDTILNAYGSCGSLAERGGWPAKEVETLDYYRGSKAFIAYPRQGDFIAIAGAQFARAVIAPSGSYEGASLFPMLVLDRH